MTKENNKQIKQNENKQKKSYDVVVVTSDVSTVITLLFWVFIVVITQSSVNLLSLRLTFQNPYGIV